MIQTIIEDTDVKETTYYGSSVEPVTLDEAKKQCIVTFNDDDDLITSLITSCRSHIEDYCHISIVQKQITLTVTVTNTLRLAFSSSDNFKENALELPYGPVIGEPDVTNISSSAGNIHITSNEGYEIIGTSFKSICLTPGRYLILYNAGYEISYVPVTLKAAILNEIAFRYEKKGDEGKRYNADQPGVCAAACVYADKHRRTWL